MPAGMGALTDLQTLRAFVVGSEDGCKIGEQKNLNSLSGSFHILRLKNVMNESEAEESALSKRIFLEKLDLEWDWEEEDEKEEEIILERLRPHFGLKQLQILFYRGSVLPSWISNPSFGGFVRMTVYECINCRLLPSIGNEEAG